MTRQLAWLTVLLASLMFTPVERWESYVPVAAIVGALGVILACTSSGGRTWCWRTEGGSGLKAAASAAVRRSEWRCPRSSE
jgi:hypothetical protein